jgi:indole-3-glycerol phosphate synthase
MAYLQQVGAQAVLIGEHFMRQPIVEQAVHDLMGTRVQRAK